MGHRSDEWYRKMGMVEYTNNSYAGDPKNKKSITRYCFFFGGAIIT